MTENNKLKNKIVKHFWLECQTKDGIDWDSIDGSANFENIPVNSRGNVELEIGGLRTIIDNAEEAFTKERCGLLHSRH